MCLFPCLTGSDALTRALLSAPIGLGLGAGDVRIYARAEQTRHRPRGRTPQDDGAAAVGHRNRTRTPLPFPFDNIAMLETRYCTPPPPSQSTLRPRPLQYYIIHFTYGMDYTLDGVFTPGKYGQWRFDKRSYATRSTPPPFTFYVQPARGFP
jgi:hypothetical protein